MEVMHNDNYGLWDRVGRWIGGEWFVYTFGDVCLLVGWDICSYEHI
jgi:hypothetical protein